VHLGFPDVLSRLCQSSLHDKVAIDDLANARHLLKYIFPRQHELHNVFTCPRDRRITIYAFHDYEDREAEIKARGRMKTPKRLKSMLTIAQEILEAHSKLDYRALLNKCCPSKVRTGSIL
jgi:telomerase reverse transcriptase